MVVMGEKSFSLGGRAEETFLIDKDMDWYSTVGEQVRNKPARLDGYSAAVSCVAFIDMLRLFYETIERYEKKKSANESG